MAGSRSVSKHEFLNGWRLIYKAAKISRIKMNSWDEITTRISRRERKNVEINRPSISWDLDWHHSNDQKLLIVVADEH